MYQDNQELPLSKKQMDPNEFNKLYKLIKKQIWLEDRYEELIELWNLCVNKREKNLIEDLLNRFVILNSEKIEKSCVKIATHICDVWNLEGKYTKIVAMCYGDKPDGSQYVIQYIKNKFANKKGWREGDFINNLNTFGIVVYKAKGDQNVVLIDDFIGTGNTATRKCKWLIKKFRENNKKRVKIYVVSLACMEIAIKKITDLGINFYTANILKKGISGYYFGNKLKENTRSMENLESTLHTNYKHLKLSKFNFGYDRSESLFSIQGANAPNNVFPIFWWPVLKNNYRRNTLLKRII